MKQLLILISIFSFFCSQAQYQDPVEIYKDSLDPNLSSIYQNYLLEEINGQGNKDILSVKTIDENTQEVGVFTHFEESTFEPFTNFQSSVNQLDKEALFYKDINNDNQPDIIYVSDRNRINVLTNLGNGNYSNPDTTSIYSQITNRNFRINAIDDIDGDNDLDLIITQYKDMMYPPLEDSSEIIFGWNDGAGNFSFEYMTNEFSAAYYKVELADFDGDNDLDLITVGFGFAPEFGIEVPWYEFPFFNWYKNDGEGSFSAPIQLEMPQRVERYPSVSDIHIADLEGDGDMDVFASFAIRDTCEDQIHAFNCSFIYVYSIWKFDDSEDNLVQISETNSWPHNYLIKDNNDYYKDFFNPVYSDFNNDGNIDILTINTITNNVFWRIGDGSGFFDNQTIVADLNNYGIRPTFKVADMDFDGDLDIVSLLNSDSLSLLQYYKNGQSGATDFDNDGFIVGVDCDDLDSLIGDVLPNLDYEFSIFECENSDIQFSTENEIQNANYHWFGPNSFSSSVSEPLIEDIGEEHDGIYTVYATLNQCTSDTSEIEVIVFESPNASIEQAGDSLIANVIEFAGYNWYLNGILIDGALSDVYYPTESGFYQVEIIDDLGCSNISDSLQVNIVGIDQNVTSQLKLYPNPVRNGANINLEVNDQIEYPINVKIIDASGKLYYTNQILNPNSKLREIDLNSGIYYIKLQNPTMLFVEQIVIID